ncbi:hypothetical protein FACS189494_04840 [Spirochaetia bacterium]|nr:hypothetical protein FACS189494_04840 [Spirochaetia bacterium]
MFFSVNVFGATGDTRWFIANPAGMALEESFQIRALRAKNALQITDILPENIPQEIRKYYSEPWTITRSILYENGKRVKTQWVFSDEEGISLFVAVIGNDGSGFIEWYNEKGYIVEEQRLDADGSGFFISYEYKDSFLIRSLARHVEAVPQEGEIAAPDTSLSEEKINAALKSALPDETPAAGIAPPPRAPETPGVKVADMVRNPEGAAAIQDFFVAVTGREGGILWTDSYKYSRSASLRAIERVFNDKEAAKELVRFPRFMFEAKNNDKFVTNSGGSASPFINDVVSVVPSKITYTTDNKHRILTETHRNEDGEIVGELTNLWNNDRLTQVTWRSKDEERRIVYVYTASGECISEYDYRNNVLERVVTIEGADETEELYKDGKVVLRAQWEDGRKISEERVTIN